MKIKVLLVVPNQEVQAIKIPASTKFIKSFIGKNLYKVRLTENAMLIANNDADNTDFNRILKNNIVLGSFIIVGIKHNHYASLRKKQIHKFFNRFKLEKHQKKIEKYREEYLEEFYYNQKIAKQKNAERNKNQIFDIAA